MNSSTPLKLIFHSGLLSNANSFSSLDTKETELISSIEYSDRDMTCATSDFDFCRERNIITERRIHVNGIIRIYRGCPLLCLWIIRHFRLETLAPLVRSDKSIDGLFRELLEAGLRTR